MPAMPAWCPQCKEWVDGAGGIYIDGGTHTLSGSIVSCPRGHRARVIEGEISIRDGIIDVIRAAPWARDKLPELRGALQWAADNFEQQPAEAIKRIEEHSPEVAQSVRGLRSYFTKRQIAMALAGAAIYVAGSVGDNLVDRVMDEVWPRDDPPSTSQPINQPAAECPELPNEPHPPPSSESSEPPPQQGQSGPNPEPPETQSPP